MQYSQPAANKNPQVEQGDRYTSEDADEFLLTNGKFVKGGLRKLLYRRHSIDGSRKNLNRNQQRRSILKKEGETFANSLLNRARDSVTRGRPRNSVQFMATTHGDSSLNQNTSEGSPDNTRAVFRGIGNPFRVRNLVLRSKFLKFNARRKSILNASERDASEKDGSRSRPDANRNFQRPGVIRLKPALGKSDSQLGEEAADSDRGSKPEAEAQDPQPKRRENLVREIDTGAGLRLVMDKISDKSSENSELSKHIGSKDFGRLESKKRSESFASAKQQLPADLEPIQKLISDFAVYQKAAVPSLFSPKARNLPPRHFATPTPMLSATTKNKDQKFFNPYTVSELPGSSKRIPQSSKSPTKVSANFRELVRETQTEDVHSPLKPAKQPDSDPMDALRLELRKARQARDSAQLRFSPAYRKTAHGFTVVERDDLNYLKPVPMISPRLKTAAESPSKQQASPRKRGKKELQILRQSQPIGPQAGFFRVLNPKHRHLLDSTDLFKKDLQELRRSLGTQPLTSYYFESKRSDFGQP